MTPTFHIEQAHTQPNSFHIYFSHTKDNLEHIPQELREGIEIKAKRVEFTSKKNELLHMEFILEKEVKHVVLLGLGDAELHGERVMRDQMMRAIQVARKVKAQEVVIHIEKEQSYIQYIAEGVILGDYSLDTFRSEIHNKKNPHIKDVYLITVNMADTAKLLHKGINAANANILARDLVNLPGSHVFPEVLAEYAKNIEKKSKGMVSVEILNEEQCKKLGMGSFLSVGQGSDKKSVFIILHYKGTGSKKFALVGKSITFDTGGLSLKPGEYMMDMKNDMAGGAAVLGVFDYLAAQHPEVTAFSDVYGILPAAENMVSGAATRPGDVVTAMNGKTIEILNTDAEGRLVLADGLVYAETVLKADYIMDLATLTGACVVALGNDLAGLFSTHDAFEKQYRAFAQKAGDDYWRMPLHEGYLEQMKSTIADLKNIGGGRYGGAITAALFLKEFIKKAPWIHMDFGGPAHSEKKGASGWGVLSVIYFLEQLKNI